MADVKDGTANPTDQQSGGAGDTNTQTQTRADGSRADTSRVADATSEQTQDDKPKDKSFSFKEDRSDWIPRTRLNEESGKRTKLEQEVAELRKQSELNEKRVRLALGLEVPSKDEQETQEAREALYKLNPKLKLLDQLDENQLQRILDAADSATESTRAQWKRHSSDMLSDLEGEASELLGVDALSEAQTKRLHRAFREEAREQGSLRAKAERAEDAAYDYDNDFVARYERGDKTLLREFAKAFLDEWGIPARRAVTTSAVQRQTRPVPRGERSRSHLTQTPPKIDYNDDKAFRDAILATRQDGGSV